MQQAETRFEGDSIREFLKGFPSEATRDSYSKKLRYFLEYVGVGRINEVAEMFRRKMGAYERPVIHRGARRGEIKHSWASIQRARKEIGYKPATGVGEGVGRFISWYYPEPRGQAEL